MSKTASRTRTIGRLYLRIEALEEQLKSAKQELARLIEAQQHKECLANPNVCHCSAKGACWNHR